MPKVIVYTKDYCAFCRHAKALLASKGVEFEEINIEHDEALQDEVRRKSGQFTVPQIFVDDQPLGGYQEIRMLDMQGELDGILKIDS
ncbi:MAG: glutaredoxin 3 [Deltaproteobacteria bacterium]|nr:glutaredoxin 3 [Deltaproteobacteria bacterium]